MAMEITFSPIGVMHCELNDSETAPKYYTESDVAGVIEVFDPYAEGLANLEEYEYIVVLFHFHRAKGYDLRQKRRGVGELRGVFSLCSPNRPNGIGLSILRLVSVEGNLLHVHNVDLLDDTPILDIKPYKPQDYPR
ncbi:MAG TPA: tRNA (N6-threonylcarbamoyladenosine(37)-N6)-methyltransferase TrmO [Deltaproteobacteria bacterium]|nr:tRNA (N6-threonylcarbamoyladenosine(37)-N6)-methyltransferase TrmO [Deltaproteobacteria bacterium]HQI80363.1 tRNA (N6-threonylcarbamoyladenosine(37)-N6)-methyltransferase TrmO [Deltaproteobacteria bacterium]